MAVLDEVTLPADWLVPSAEQRLPFSVQGEGLSASVDGFPVLVRFDNDDLDFAAADAQHLVFTAGDDSTPLSYQVEKWDPTGTSVWVKVPSLSDEATEIELYFDGAPENATTPSEVWDSSYLTVNHFDAASGNFPDATVNGWAGTAIGTNSTYGAASQSGTPAYRINGSNTYVDFGTEMASSSTAQVTLSTSVLIDPTQCTSTDAGYRVLAGRDIGGGKMPGETYSLVCYQGKVFPRFIVNNTGVNAAGGNAIASTPWSAGWHDVATTFDGSTIQTYVDGDLKASYAISGAIGDGIAPPTFVVDGYSSAPGGVKMGIDEMRLSTVSRSADWLKAEHLAQSGGLVTVGDIESPSQLQLSVTSPTAGEQLSGTTLELTGSASGADVSYQLDEASPVALGHVNGEFAATVTDVTVGGHTVVVTAVDGDSQKTVTRSFTVVESVPEGAPGLSLSDGDVVSGSVDIVATPNGGTPSADAVEIAVDGEPLPVTARDEQASAVIDVKGWQTGFVQEVTLNGQTLSAPHADVNGPMPLEIPDGLLHEGDNTLRISTGSSVQPRDTTRNNDDFTISDPRIEFDSSGRALRDPSVDPTASLAIGDGYPAGSVPAIYFREFHFTVAPGGLNSYVATWDSALGPDGDHEVTATTDGGTTSATVVSDNTAPSVSFQQPTDGGTYTGSFTVDVTAADLHGVDTLTLALDGAAVEQGDVIDIDAVGAGPHTLTAHAIDKSGNADDVSVTFNTIGNAPEAPTDPTPADGATNVDPGRTELSVTASDPAGDALDVTFKRASQKVAASVRDGSTKAGIPGVDDGAAVPAGSKLAEVDGQSVTTTADKAYPFQQFEVAVPSGLTADEFQVAWNGSVPQGHRAALSVWNHATSKWELIADGAGGDALALSATASIADHVRDGVAQILVQDVPKVVLDDDDVTTISWLTDTQNYAERESTTYDKQIQWTLDHWKTDDIAYGVHTGDIVNVASQRFQWDNASRSHELWDEAGFPYGVVPGNHDIASGQYETYREFFGEDRFKDNPWYGGTNQDNVQHLDLFSTPDADYLFLYVDWSLSQDEIDWANEVITSHPGYNVILATHQYLLNGGAYVTPGQTIFDQIVLPNPNVKMILSGHTPGVAMNIKRPSAGRVVVEVMQDSQSVGYAGDGWMRTFDMDATHQTTTHRTFSVNKAGNNFAGNSSTFVAPADWSGTTNAENFTVPMDIELATREVSTDALVVTTLSEDELAGTVHVNSGERASVTVTDLAPASTHQWYAEAKDADGFTSVSDVFTFTTAEQSAGLGVLSGSVTSGSGDPVAGACVYLYTAPEAPSAAYASCAGDDGTFTVSGVEPGAYDVAVADPSGKHATWWSPAPVTVDENAEPLVVTLTGSTTGAVAGVVTGGSAGTDPLSGVCAFAYPHGDSTTAAYATCSDSSGAYGLYGVDAGAYDMAFFDPAGIYPTQWWTGETAGSADQLGATAATVTGGETNDGVNAVLVTSSAGIVAGTVTDAAGPVAGACVYLYASSEGPAAYATCTGADGHYWLPGVESGSAYKLVVADPTAAHVTQWWTGAPGGAGSYAGGAELAGVGGGLTVTADVELAPVVNGGVAGTVTGSGGVPFGGGCVYLYPVADGAGAAYASCGQADGTYLVPAVADGDYQAAFFDPSATYATQWWTGAVGGAATQSGAAEVIVAGAVKTGIDAALVPVG